VREKWLIALEMQIINESSGIFPNRILLDGIVGVAGEDVLAVERFHEGARQHNETEMIVFPDV
jgi:hypothetical protein